MNEREISYLVLKQVYLEDKYANLALKNILKKIEKQKRAFVVELVNGVIRNDLYLKSQFIDLIRVDTKLSVQLILMMAFYEKQFMNSVDYAIVNEYVSITNKKSKSLVNAILRNYLNRIIKSEDNSLEDISTNYSLPLWIVKMIHAQHGEEFFKNFIIDYQDVKPVVFYHLNTNLASKEDLKDIEIEFVDDVMFTAKESLVEHPLFKLGYFYIQDFGAKKITDYLDLSWCKRVLDVCAAPGSKSFNILEKLTNKQSLFINDISESRLQLIQQMAKQLGYETLNYWNIDGRDVDKQGLQFDCILADVPCSGLGVLKRKVDLKNKIQSNNIDDLLIIQREILDSCYKSLEKNGILLYSTCTINKKENQRQIQNFLKTYSDMELLDEEVIMNGGGSDIFYIAKMRKI